MIVNTLTNANGNIFINAIEWFNITKDNYSSFNYNLNSTINYLLIYCITRFSNYTFSCRITSCKIPADSSYKISLSTADNSAIEGLTLESRKLYFSSFKSDSKYSIPYLRLESYK